MKKRSMSVPLVLLGTMSLVGCEPVDNYSSNNDSVEVAQSYYTSKEECEQDWTDDPTLCKEEPAPSTVASSNNNDGGHTGGGSNFIYLGNSSAGSNQSPTRWAGPRYYWDRNIEKPVVVSENGSLRVMENSSIRSTAPSAHASSHTTSTHYASSSGTSRGGFGGFSHGYSSGG